VIDLHKGDCLEVMDKLIAKGVKVDAIITDPPYGTTRNVWDAVVPLDEMWLRVNLLSRERAPVLLFSQTPFDKVLGASNIQNLKYEWIWQKSESTGFLNAKKVPLKNHENVLVFYKKQPTYNPQFTEGTPYKYKKNSISSPNYGESKGTGTIENEGRRYPVTVQSFKKDRGLHPTQKPVAFLEYLVKTYTNEGDTVLDFTMGSGTTGIACVKTNRRFIGIELDENYFNIAKTRIDAAIVEKYPLLG
jgi:site-specific DNA-methyltransferase (adenine-specific)